MVNLILLAVLAVLLVLVAWQLVIFSQALPKVFQAFGIDLPGWSLAMAAVILILLVLLYAIKKMRS